MPDNVTMEKELNRIAIGSVDIYIQEFSGSSMEDIPEDSAIEIEDNLIGRTKDGGEISYTMNYFTAKSDDGKASRSDLTEDSAYISFGVITWNGNTVVKLIETAESKVESGKRRTLIGGVSNVNGKTYLVRAVHKDKVKGDVKYTLIGKNVSGFAASYKPGTPSTITPRIDAKPFNNGRLIIMDEFNVDTTEPETTTTEPEEEGGEQA